MHKDSLIAKTASKVITSESIPLLYFLIIFSSGFIPFVICYFLFLLPFCFLKLIEFTFSTFLIFCFSKWWWNIGVTNFTLQYLLWILLSNVLLMELCLFSVILYSVIVCITIMSCIVCDSYCYTSNLCHFVLRLIIILWHFARSNTVMHTQILIVSSSWAIEYVV